MSFYMKNFVFASLFYLTLAVIFGILNGVTDIGYFGIFAHTHFNLLGFMSMMIFGIGYFILPRFNGTDLRYPSWITIHFYIGNISLIGMVVFRGMEVTSGNETFRILFIIFAALQALSIFMFIYNVWVTLLPKKKEAEVPAPSQPTTSQFSVNDDSTKPNISVTPDTKIADLVDRLPSLLQTLVNCGLLALQMPGHIDKVRQMGITIGTAAANHSLDLDNMILVIEKELQDNGFTTRPDLDTLSEPAATDFDPASLDTSVLIGDVISGFPKSRDLFQKYFGDGCFDCPGQSYESIDMACRMHGVDPDTFLAELKKILQ